MDDLDVNIVQILLKNAREPLSNIAKSTGVSTAAIHQRVKKMEEKQIILGTKILIDEKKLGYMTMAYVGIFLEKAKYYKAVVDKLRDVPEIVECSFTTGNYSLLTKMVCKDNLHLMRILSDKIQSIDGIARTETFICLEQAIDRAIQVE